MRSVVALEGSVVIGSQEEALRALQIARALRHVCPSEVREPGWEWIDRGTSRIALRGPGGAVYKVPVPLRPNWEEGLRSNQREAENLARWEGKDFVPEWRRFDVPDENDAVVPIIAMEFLENDGTEATNMEQVCAALREVDAEDRHEGNFRVRNGRAIIIDAGGKSEDFLGPFYVPHQPLPPELNVDPLQAFLEMTIPEPL
jgi:hypothetical protein